MSAADVEWIGVDWGTTNLRAWAMSDGKPVAGKAAPLGMGGLKRDNFEPALLGVIGDWLPGDGRTQVVACGMVGARQGWVEVPYAQSPCPPLAAGAMRRVPTSDQRIDVTIIHGISQALPPDVMRGEETQVAGLVEIEPGFAGLACLPGTHTKWVKVAGGRIQNFRTFMTGELFGLAATHSILRHSAGDDDTRPDPAAFDAAVVEAAGEPAAIAAQLFSTRAAGLLAGLSPEQARGRISGLLIGLEIEALRQHWREAPVTIIGATALAGSYARALGLLGCADFRSRTVDECTLAGLRAAYALIARQ